MSTASTSTLHAHRVRRRRRDRRARLLGLTTASIVAFLVSSPSLSVVGVQCPPIPPDRSSPCPLLFNGEGSSVGQRGLLSSWLVPVHALVEPDGFSYHDGVGSRVPCDVPEDTITCRGVDYPPSCFQCLAVRAPFAGIPYVSRPAGAGFTAYDHTLHLNYSVPIDNSDIVRRVVFPPSLRVVLQTTQSAQLPREIRWDYQGRKPVMNLEEYEVDAGSPEDGVDAAIGFWITFPAWVHAAGIRIDRLSDGVESRSARLIRDCDSAGENDDCAQLFRLDLHAKDFWRCNFDSDIAMTLFLDCRHPKGCSDFSDGTPYKVDIWLKTSSWCPQDPWERFGLINRLNVYNDAGHSRPNQGALNWNNEYFFRYTTDGAVQVTFTHIGWINVTHPHRATVDGAIWNGTHVNTDLIDIDHLHVRCPEPGSSSAPLNECQFDWTLAQSDPLWNGVRDEAFLKINVHLEGRVGYKDGEQPGQFVHRDVPVVFSFDNGNKATTSARPPRMGEAPANVIKPLGIGDDSSGSPDDHGKVFYSGVGMLAVGSVALLSAALVAWKNKRAMAQLVGIDDRTPLRSVVV